jgi:Uncharacterized protein conserved in bacteria
MLHFARIALVAAASVGLSAIATVAQAKVHITVDLDAQTIHVEAKDKVFNWKVSSGKRGYETPNGTYKVLWMDKDHFSDTYDNAPMPDAIFFAPGYAIHGASKSAWGHPASHGCVRLPVGKAAILFDMVKKQGAEITLTGGSEASTEVAEKLKAGKSGDTGVVAEPVGTARQDGIRLRRRTRRCRRLLLRPLRPAT